jgi:hypothetical protein
MPPPRLLRRLRPHHLRWSSPQIRWASDGPRDRPAASYGDPAQVSDSANEAHIRGNVCFLSSPRHLELIGRGQAWKKQRRSMQRRRDGSDSSDDFPWADSPLLRLLSSRHLHKREKPIPSRQQNTIIVKGIRVPHLRN